MKIRNNIIIIAAMCLSVFCLGACGNVDGSDNQGSIVINFDKTSGRYAVSDADKAEMIYTIKLNSPGKAAIETKTAKGAKYISISVPEGTWDIDVKAEGEGKRIGKGTGNKADVTVSAGKPASVNIEIKITGTRVSSWAELVEDFNELNVPNGKLKDLDNIEIVKDLAASTGLELLRTTQTVTLWAKKDVRITRGKTQNLKPVFTIEKCTIILDGTKGKITIEGNGRDNLDCTRAIINVMENSILRMFKGVTLTNNHTTNYGGGVYVENGIFKMEGGTISGNRARSNGGGVYIAPKGGSFEKTDGTIYGSEADVDKNIADTRGGGDAVYDKGTIWDRTLGPNDSWPRR